MANPALRTEGLGTVLAALKKFEVEAHLALRAALKESGELVRKDAEQRFEGYDPKSAMGYRVYLRAGRVDVEQTLARTTGRRPDYGALQMRKALVPSLDEKRDEIHETIEAAIAVAAERF